MKSKPKSRNLRKFWVVAKVTTCGHFVFFLFLEVKCSNSDLWHQVSILHFCMHNLRHIKIHQPIQIVRSQSSCAKAWQSFFMGIDTHIFTPVYEYLFITKHSLTPQRQVKNMFFGFLKVWAKNLHQPPKYTLSTVLCKEPFF